MSEKFELIDAKDLPMTEEEDVTVLCVGADGEMVRKDAGSFGGGGYILKPTVDEIVWGDPVRITADCTDMVKAIETGANVIVAVPAKVISEGAPATLWTIIGWSTISGALSGAAFDGVFVFPNAPIPSFLQG